MPFAEVVAGLRQTLLPLRNPAFTRLYLAQLVHLLGMHSCGWDSP